MYRFKDKEIMGIYNKKKVANVIGLNEITLRQVVNGKQLCSKLVAYCITKFLSNSKEIFDYFDYVEKN